ncbi:MAG: hypothetical protein ABSD49_12845 [Candidatus Bathyarchaeia archaeon]
MIHEFLEKVNPNQKKYFTTLQTALLALPEIEESLEIDDMEGEWCPAYRVRGSDLVWVHFDERLWISFPVEPKFEKKVAQDENLDSEIMDAVKDAEESGGVKTVKMHIKSAEEVDSVIPLLRLRHSVLMS